VLDSSDAQQSLLKRRDLPGVLCRFSQGLKGATTTVSGKDARRSATIIRGMRKFTPSSQPAGALTLLQLNLSLFARQKIVNNDDPSIPSSNAFSIAIKVGTFQADPRARPWRALISNRLSIHA
jgi:hypothetical protein